MAPVKRLLLLSVVVAGAATACAQDGDAPQVSADAGFVEIGDAPGPVTGNTFPTVPDLTAPAPTTTTTSPPIEPPVGAVADGDYVLLIGDDVLAETAERNDGPGCEVLTELGWDVEIAAEPARFVPFASQVLEARLPADPDVVTIMLGHRHDGSVADYRGELRDAIAAAAGRPILLVTLGGVYESDEIADPDTSMRSLNAVIEGIDRDFPNVVLVDWNEATETDPDQLLAEGGPTPSEEGTRQLTALIADVLGDAPGRADDGEPGECLETAFDSDDAIIL